MFEVAMIFDKYPCISGDPLFIASSPSCLFALLPLI